MPKVETDKIEVPKLVIIKASTMNSKGTGLIEAIILFPVLTLALGFPILIFHRTLTVMTLESIAEDALVCMDSHPVLDCRNRTQEKLHKIVKHSEEVTLRLIQNSHQAVIRIHFPSYHIPFFPETSSIEIQRQVRLPIYENL